MGRHGPPSFPREFSLITAEQHGVSIHNGCWILGTREHVLPELTQSFSQSAGVTYDGKLLISACALLHEKEIIAGGIYGWFQRISHNFYRNWNQYQDIR